MRLLSCDLRERAQLRLGTFELPTSMEAVSSMSMVRLSYRNHLLRRGHDGPK